MEFQLIKKDLQSNARCGKFTTAHGGVQTPAFMPVGTLANVKGVHQKELVEDIKAEIILGNTYHLYLRPGIEIIRKAGGLHKFMNWNRPILTDSGGFQVFSLANNRKISEENVTFRSHIDGSSHVFTPENVINVQRTIGADIIMAFDECPPGTASYDYAKKSLALTERWLERCKKQFEKTNPLYGYEQTLFPVIQGCVYEDLRKRAARHSVSLDFDGYAIGGLSVGEPAEIMYKMIETVQPLLPEKKPRYLMGVGTPANLLEAIERGIDMFDCVMPTRNARHGLLFTSEGIINIKNKKWADDFSLLDKKGKSFVDKTYSKAYLRHLLISKEILASQICSHHNLAFYLWLMEEARNQIMNENFSNWKKEIIPKLMSRL